MPSSAVAGVERDATPEFAGMLVAIPPGITTVTRTRVPRHSALRPSVSSFTAAFDAP